MDWNKAKNLIIIFLMGLNVVLLLLIFMHSPRHTLAHAQEAAILEVLRANNVAIHAPIPRSYAPMAQMRLFSPHYDMTALHAFFFDEDAVLTRTTDYEQVVYTDQHNRTLTIFSDGLVLFDGLFLSADEFGAATIREVCDALVAASALTPNFIFDHPDPHGIATDRGYRLEYRQLFNGQLVFGNFIAFSVTEEGIVQIAYNYASVDGFESNRRSLISPDEALFAFMRHMLNLYGIEREAVVTHMDIVYHQEESPGRDVTVFVAVPCYRFWVEGMENPYLINAYTGRIASRLGT